MVIAGSPPAISCSGGAADDYRLFETAETNPVVTAKAVRSVVPANQTITAGSSVPRCCSTWTYDADPGHEHRVATPAIRTAPTCSSISRPTTPADRYPIPCAGRVASRDVFDDTVAAILTVNPRP